MTYVIDRMREEDIPEVIQIERQAFNTSWSPHAYRRELRENRLARYIVARWVEEDEGNRDEGVVGSGQATETEPQGLRGGVKGAIWRILAPWRRSTGPATEPSRVEIGGYAGLWLMVDEAHVTTIAVRPHLRGRGLGETLLLALADIAVNAGAAKMTLEVRVSNREAQSLYRKFGFKEEGVRRRYYSDNNEDALIMWSEPLASSGFTKRISLIRQEVQRKWRTTPLPPPVPPRLES